MRVLLVNKYWHPRGGSERYTFLLKDLLESRGHGVILFGMEDERNPLHFLWNRTAAMRIRAIIDESKPDIAHLQNFTHQISPSILPVLRRHGVPIVWTLHDLDVFWPGYRTQDAWGRRFAAYVEYVLHHGVLDVYRKHIAVIIAPSRFAAEAVRAWGWKGRVETISNFILGEHSNDPNPDPNTPNIRGIRIRHSRHSDVPTVLFVGRLSEEKGVEDFLEAARRLPEIPFEVVGDGPRGISNLSAKGGSASGGKSQISNCRWLGALPPEEAQRRIAAAAMVVVPSVVPEIAPYVILEAMAAGVPVIASRIGGIPELVRDGETGVLVPPRDSETLAKTIEMVYRDEVQRRRFGERARTIVAAEYGAERHYERVMEVYRSLGGS